jgi:outer membrane protein OmpA-like peptidoglycan-associated protein
MTRTSMSTQFTQCALALALCTLLLAFPTTARATDLAIKIEPGVTLPLTDPQSSRFDVGASQAVKALFGITPWFDIGPTASFLFLPAATANTDSGTAWGLGAGIRLKRPHDGVSMGGISPWFDADALYVRTGDLHRPGFDAALGLAIPVGASRAFWIGPFVRYMQTIQSERLGYDNSDAKLLTLGISFEVGPGTERAPEPAEVRTVTKEVIVTKEVVKEVPFCADRDKDGVPDSVDRCPEVAGSADDWGCPPYKKVIVKRDKLELKEKLYFAWDEAKLEEASFPVLDEVVQALKDNKNFRVQVEGHTDSSGADDHNQTLSEKRAKAVLDYLVSHGVPKERLVSKGFSSSVPLDTNTTAAGRENNRRVEFVVNFIILNDGGAK